MTMALVKDECVENIDIEKSCRICLARTTTMSNIFDGESNDIVDKVYFCSGVLFKEQPELSSLICEVCLTNLSIAYKFKTTCILAEESIKKMILNGVKIEKLDYEDGLIETLDDEFNIEFDHYDDKVSCNELKEVKKEYVEVEVNEIVSNRRSKRSVVSQINIGDNVKIEKIKPKRPDGSKQAIRQVRHNIDKIKGIPCKPCKISFKTQEEANEHKKEFHKYEGAVCEVCGKVFHNRSSMISHVRLHLPPTFNCEHCPYATVNKHDLKKHTHIHTGVKQYQCSECPRLFRTSSNVSQHVLRHHRQRLQHACNMCDKRFFDAYKLRRHLDSHNSIKRHECSVCHSHFTRRCYWKQHLLKQHGITTPPQRPGRQKLNVVIQKLCTSSQEAV